MRLELSSIGICVENETAEQLKKYPDTLDVFKTRNPSLAYAIRGMRANKEHLQTANNNSSQEA